MNNVSIFLLKKASKYKKTAQEGSPKLMYVLFHFPSLFTDISGHCQASILQKHPQTSKTNQTKKLKVDVLSNMMA